MIQGARNPTSPVRRVIRMVMALPLLPPEGAFGIMAGLEAIRSEAEQQDVLPLVEELLRYVSDHWIRRIGVHRMSVYSQPIRTNNHSEGLNRGFNEYVGRRRRPVDFIGNC